MLLEYIHITEGRVRFNGGFPEYDYYLKDHLGNTRIVFTEENGAAKELQVSNYYPFGMRFNQSNTYDIAGKTSQYMYNGKELQEDFGLDMYDYGARFYDGALGRFMTQDPLAETYNYQSTYAYAINNPIRFTDFMGMGPDDKVEDDDPPEKKEEQKEEPKKEKLSEKYDTGSTGGEALPMGEFVMLILKFIDYCNEIGEPIEEKNEAGKEVDLPASEGGEIDFDRGNINPMVGKNKGSNKGSSNESNDTQTSTQDGVTLQIINTTTYPYNKRDTVISKQEYDSLRKNDLIPWHNVYKYERD